MNRWGDCSVRSRLLASAWVAGLSLVVCLGLWASSLASTSSSAPGRPGEWAAFCSSAQLPPESCSPSDGFVVGGPTSLRLDTVAASPVSGAWAPTVLSQDGWDFYPETVTADGSTVVIKATGYNYATFQRTLTVSYVCGAATVNTTYTTPGRGAGATSYTTLTCASGSTIRLVVNGYGLVSNFSAVPYTAPPPPTTTPAPTPTPTATATPTASPTATPTATAVPTTPVPTTSAPVPTTTAPTASPTGSPTQTPNPSPTSTPPGTVEPTTPGTTSPTTGTVTLSADDRALIAIPLALLLTLQAASTIRALTRD